MMYQEGYKYRLKKDFIIDIPFAERLGEFWYDNGYVSIDYGRLIIRAGYAWDGASGVPDGSDVMVPSLVHDAMYQLLREGALPPYLRMQADHWFGDMCHERGMWRWLADLYVFGLEVGGERASRVERPTLLAA